MNLTILRWLHGLNKLNIMKPVILSSYNNTDHIRHNLEMFKTFGYDVKVFKFLNKDFFRKSSKVVYLNWYENIETDKPGAISVFLKFLLKVVTLRYMQCSNLKVITSFHNKKAHAKLAPALAKYIFKLVFKVADKVVVFNKCGFKDLECYLSKEEIGRKAVLVPAVNYIGHYPYVKHNWITELQAKPQMKILFAGRMKQPYKNVPMVMEIARELQDKNILFVFAGNAKEYKAEYMALTEGLSNVVAEFRFVEDNEMAQLLEMCDAMIVPYNVESISNSGTARLAFSYARTVICPDIPFLEDIPHDLIYTYNYKNHADHKEQLRNVILEAYADWQKDSESLHQKGDSLINIMKECNSPEVITEKYKLIFNELNN